MRTNKFNFKGDEVMASATAVGKQKVHRARGDGQEKKTTRKAHHRMTTRNCCWFRRRLCG